MSRPTRTLAGLLLALLGLAALAPAARAQDPAALLELMNMLNGQGGEDGQDPDAPPPLPPATPLGEDGNTGFSPTDTGRFDLHGRNLDVAEAFAQLRQLIRRNIVVAPEVEARFNGDLYEVTPEEAIEAICHSTNLVHRDEGSFIYIEPAAIDTRIYELMHARAADLVLMIEPLLSQDGAVSSTIASQQGIRSSQEEAGGDDYAAAEVLVVTDFPHILEQVEKIVAIVDKPPQQVLIEATILSAELNDGLQMGVQFSSLSGIDWEDGNTISSDGLTVQDSEFSGADLGDGISTVATGLADTISTGGMNVGIIKDGVNAFLRALTSVTETTLLANPRILTVNKQRGEVLLGRRDGFLTTTVTQTATIQSIEYLETGTRLLFRPFITADGMVRLEVHPEDSDGGVNAEGLPFKETAEITTNVIVRSGETVVIGGLFREREQTIDKAVPFLGDLPLLGWLFRSKVQSTVREEIICLMTPRIVDYDEEILADAEGAPPWEFSDVVDTQALAGSFLESARTLRDQDKLAAAAYMLDLAEELIGGVDEIRDLRREVWTGRVRPIKTATIDQRLTERLLAPPEAAP